MGLSRKPKRAEDTDGEDWTESSKEVEERTRAFAEKLAKLMHEKWGVRVVSDQVGKDGRPPYLRIATAMEDIAIELAKKLNIARDEAQIPADHISFEHQPDMQPKTVAIAIDGMIVKITEGKGVHMVREISNMAPKAYKVLMEAGVVQS